MGTAPPGVDVLLAGGLLRGQSLSLQGREAEAEGNLNAYSFNSMTGVDHCKPGIAATALAHAEYAELIPELQQVRPGAIRQANS